MREQAPPVNRVRYKASPAVGVFAIACIFVFVIMIWKPIVAPRLQRFSVLFGSSEEQRSTFAANPSKRVDTTAVERVKRGGRGARAGEATESAQNSADGSNPAGSSNSDSNAKEETRNN